MARAAAHSDSEESAKSKPKDEVQEEEDGSGGEEYEIEEVLDAKRGVFPEGRLGYFVKWKGYGPQDNSWVDENDAENAKDLVDEFWRKNPAKKRNDRKSLDKKSAEKVGKSTAEESDAAEPPQPKKRGRKSNASKAVAEDADMEVDRPEPAAKRARKSQATKRSKSETPESSAKVVGNMDKFKNLKDWEGLVASVDTVERGANDTLLVYFTLNSGDTVVEQSEMCYDRFPQKMLKFYESNLKWRSVDDD